MLPTPEHIAQLLAARLDRSLTTEEQAELEDALALSTHYPGFDTEILDEAQLTQWWIDEQRWKEEGVQQQVWDVVGKATGIAQPNVSPTINLPVHSPHFFKRGFLKYAAAIIILFGVGAYLWMTTQKEKPNIAQVDPVKHDILPGGQKAILTLADGSEIILDNAANGQIAIENGSEVVKRDGEIIYDPGQIRGEAVVYNTMSTPRGGQYQLILPDGTKVWLNAASKIIYPTIFVGKTREVKIEGEVYFEVAKNKSMPFIVRTAEENITVLGTSFNVNRYIDEPLRKISLVDGAVKVNNQLLQPGQAYSNGKIIQTNIDQDVAWKNGAFNFRNMDIETAFRQISRWYNIDIRFAGRVPSNKLGGKIGRDLNLSQVLKALTDIGIRTRIENNTLVVLPD